MLTRTDSPISSTATSASETLLTPIQARIIDVDIASDSDLLSPNPAFYGGKDKGKGRLFSRSMSNMRGRSQAQSVGTARRRSLSVDDEELDRPVEPMKAEPAQPQRPRPQRSTSSFTSFIRKLTGRSASPPQKKDISSSRGRDDPNPQAVSLLAPALLPNARASPVPQNGASNMPNLQRAAHPQEPMIPFVPVRPVLSPINTATKPIDQLSPPPRPPRRLSSNDSSTSRSKVLLGPSIPGSAVLVETGSTPVIGMVAPALEVEGMKHGEVEPWMVPLPASPMVGVLDIEEEVSDPREALRTSGKEISQSEGGVPTSQEDRSPLSPVPVSTGEPSFAEKDDEEEESDTFQPLHTPSEPAPPLTIRIPQNSTHQHEGPSPLSNTSVSPVSAFSPYTPVSEGERDMRFAGSSPPRKAPIGTGKVSGLGRKDSRWKTSVMSLSDKAPRRTSNKPPPTSFDAYSSQQRRIASNRASCAPTLHSTASIVAELREIKDKEQVDMAETFFLS